MANQGKGCELDYEEIKQKLKAMEEENKNLKLETMKNEHGMAASGRLLLSSFRIFNVNAEVTKLVRCLLETSENLEKTLAKASMQFNDIHILETKVNDLNEKLTEIKDPGFPFGILVNKENKQAAATKESVLPKDISAVLGPTRSAKIESIVNVFIGVTITQLWNIVSCGLNSPNILSGIQGALIATLLLKVMSEEKEKLALQELPASSKMVLNDLSSHIRNLEPLTITADKLDQVLHKELGMSLYSDEFREFCFRNKPGYRYYTNSEDLNMFISTLSKDTRENVLRIMSDKELEKPLEKLAEVVWNETFLRVNALHQACKLLEALPNSYCNRVDDYVLNAVQFACQQVLPSNGHGKEKSDLKEIADGIVRMRNDYKKIIDLYSLSE